MNKCTVCNQDIPADSEFCPFCGSKLISKKRKLNKFEIALMCISVVLLGVSIFLGVCWYESELQVRKANYEIRKGNETITKLGYEVIDLTKERDDLSSETANLKSNNQRLQDHIDYYDGQEGIFETTLNYLAQANTTNGIISVNSKVYCVRKGQSITVKVNWPSKSTTQYMGVDDYNVVSASWNEDSNVKITGRGEGVAELYFGSDQGCTKKRMGVTIICY